MLWNGHGTKRHSERRTEGPYLSCRVVRLCVALWLGHEKAVLVLLSLTMTCLCYAFDMCGTLACSCLPAEDATCCSDFDDGMHGAKWDGWRLWLVWRRLVSILTLLFIYLTSLIPLSTKATGVQHISLLVLLLSNGLGNRQCHAERKGKEQHVDKNTEEKKRKREKKKRKRKRKKRKEEKENEKALFTGQTL